MWLFQSNALQTRLIGFRSNLDPTLKIGCDCPDFYKSNPQKAMLARWSKNLHWFLLQNSDIQLWCKVLTALDFTFAKLWCYTIVVMKKLSCFCGSLKPLTTVLKVLHMSQTITKNFGWELWNILIRWSSFFRSLNEEHW